MTMKYSEHGEQCALIHWYRLVCNSFGLSEQLLFAIPNGGARDQITGAMLKAEGVRAGVPDLFLAVPRGRYHGLFIEMKQSKGGRVSDVQKAIHKLLLEQGYAVEVCHGWMHAKITICEYLHLDV